MIKITRVNRSGQETRCTRFDEDEMSALEFTRYLTEFAVSLQYSHQEIFDAYSSLRKTRDELEIKRALRRALIKEEEEGEG